MSSEAKSIGSAFALTAFAVAAIAGLAAGNTAFDVLLCAIVCLIVGQAVGSAAAAVIEHVLNQHNESYRKARPIPEVGSGAPGEDVHTPSTAEEKG